MRQPQRETVAILVWHTGQSLAGSLSQLRCGVQREVPCAKMSNGNSAEYWEFLISGKSAHTKYKVSMYFDLGLLFRAVT